MDPGTLNKMYTRYGKRSSGNAQGIKYRISYMTFSSRTGYLFFIEKKALGTTWQKCYCQYIRENR